MKTIISTTTALLSAVAMYAQQQKIELPTDTLQNGLSLNIEITAGDQNLNGATVKIYQDNKFIAVLNNNLQPEMNVNLKKNSYYVMEVERAGYASKAILVSTSDPDKDPKPDSNTNYEHSVSISLDKNSGKSKKSSPLIGILYYNPQKDEYVGSPMLNDAPDKSAIISQLEKWLGS